MKSKSAEKIKLTSYDDLFGSSEVTAEEKIVSVPIRLFHTFKDHPFRVLDDEKMQETVESVKRYGILMPGIVRPYGDGEYEMVAGHRRWRACELAGMEEMPVIIREMDDDTATVIMVDTNIQREDILPSEKAHAYKMKYEAMKHQGSKGENTNRCAKNAYDIWEETAEKKSTQLIFCDLSTPKNDGTFNVYDDIREKLVEKGIPREEIAFIHEAGTEAKKAELFAKVRAGQVRILLGSTPKLGAGTNIQDRLIALHHLDCPWKPSDLEQQEGRILRQGNQNEKVKIFRYVTENTFDAYMWQILENKQKFISQIMTSKSPVRACEDVDDAALSYAEIKALATGNPYIREKMDLDIQVSKLKLMKANHTSQKYHLETDIAKNYPVQIAAQKEQIAGLRADREAVKPILEEKEKDNFSMMIGGKTYTDRKEAGTAILAACAGLKAVKSNGQIGEFHGFSLNASYDSFYQTYKLTIKRQCSYQIEIGKDVLGNLQRISNALTGIEKRLTEAEQKMENLLSQLATAQEEVEKPFPKEAELTEKMERLAELNSLLNMDEKGTSEALGMGEDIAAVADSPRCAVTMAGRVSELSHTADSVQKPSVLGKLKQAQERLSHEAKNWKHTAKKKEQQL